MHASADSLRESPERRQVEPNFHQLEPSRKVAEASGQRTSGSMIHFENDVGPFRSQFTLAPMSFSMSEEYIQLRTSLTSTLITAHR